MTISRRVVLLSAGSTAMTSLLACPAFSVARRTDGAAPPAWVPELKKSLTMAAHTLTKTLKPWTGPKTVALPEDYGFIPNSTAPATVAIQAAVDALASQWGTMFREP